MRHRLFQVRLGMKDLSDLEDAEDGWANPGRPAATKQNAYANGDSNGQIDADLALALAMPAD